MVVDISRVFNPVTPGETPGFACRTVNDLRRWFNESEYKKLKELGYKAVEVKVDEILKESATQCFVCSKKPFSKTAKTINLY